MITSDQVDFRMVQPCSTSTFSAASSRWWIPAVSRARAGARLLSYARRILALAEEARDVVARPGGDGVVRLGIPEDFAAYRLTELLSDFARSRPGLRLDVRCGLSVGFG